MIPEKNSDSGRIITCFHNRHKQGCLHNLIDAMMGNQPWKGLVFHESNNQKIIVILIFPLLTNRFPILFYPTNLHHVECDAVTRIPEDKLSVIALVAHAVLIMFMNEKKYYLTIQIPNKNS